METEGCFSTRLRHRALAALLFLPLLLIAGCGGSSHKRPIFHLPPGAAAVVGAAPQPFVGRSFNQHVGSGRGRSGVLNMTVGAGGRAQRHADGQ
jgi:hypothetical protein